MYVQLIDAFGWDALKKVIAEYRTLPAAEHPKTDDEKRDQWMVRYGRTVGRNLGPFFDAWGCPSRPRPRPNRPTARLDAQGSAVGGEGVLCPRR